MQEAVRVALTFVEGHSREDLDNDRMLELALIKAVEIVGEAASQTSEPTRNALWTVPWTDIIGMRRVLVHEYFNVDLDILWTTVQQDLPELIAVLQDSLPESA